MHPIRLPLLLALWGAAALGGGLWLHAYKAAPGLPAEAPATWPAEATLPAPAGRPTLVVVAHPRCPCTHATLGELERLLRETRAAADVRVVMVEPEGLDVDRSGGLWARAARLPGATVHTDPGGHEARRFGAATSGQALLYDDQGRLLFTGGLTASRGHEGDNAGRAALRALLTARTPETPTTPVFGCPLTAS